MPTPGLLKALRALFLLTLIFLIYTLAVQFRAGLPINTNILDLLPPSGKQHATQEASKQFLKTFAQRVFVIAQSDSTDEAKRAALRLAEQVRSTLPNVRVIERQEKLSLTALREFYFPFRNGIYSNSLAETLRSSDAPKQIEKRLYQILTSPATGGLSATIVDDPLLLFADFLTQLPQAHTDVLLDDGFLIIPDEQAPQVIIQLILPASIFDREAQQGTSQALEKHFTELSNEEPSWSFAVFGALPFAEAIASASERDIMRISSGSTLALFAFVLLLFYSIRPLLWTLTSVATGLIVATGTTLLFAGELHVITLAFGSSLIGVCADYSFHFFCRREQASEKSSDAVLSNVAPGICLGVLTSLLGYIALLTVPLPGLFQIALFSISGMLGAGLSILLFTPLVIPQRVDSPGTSTWRAAHAGANRYCGFMSRPGAVAVLLLTVAAASALLTPSLKIEDDVRAMKHAPPELQEREAAFRERFGSFDQSRFLLSCGKDIEEALQAEERMRDALEKSEDAVASPIITQAVSPYIPSQDRQLKRKETLRSFLETHEPALYKIADRIGIPSVAIDRFDRAVAEQGGFITPSVFFSSEVGNLLKDLRVILSTGQECLIAAVKEDSDASLLAPLRTDNPSTHFVDVVGDSNDILKKHRELATLYIIGCYALVMLTLMLRYGLLRGALGMLPAVIALLVTLCVQGALTVPVTLFTVLATAITLGLAIDYSIFLLEHPNEPGSAYVAISLSATTTALSFALLATSATPVLSSFGLVLSCGVTVAALSCPLVTVKRM